MIEITLCSNERPVGKSYKLNPETNTIEKAVRGGSCNKAHRVQLESLEQLNDIIESLSNCQFITNGSIKPAGVEFDVLRAKVLKETPIEGTIARSQEYMGYRAEAPIIFLLDYDPAPDQPALSRAEFEQVINDVVMPGFVDTVRLVRKSSSGRIQNPNGSTFKNSFHYYIIVTGDLSKPRIKELKKIFTTRLFNAGYGWIEISPNGAKQVKVIVDIAVFGRPEMPIYAGPPTIARGSNGLYVAEAEAELKPGKIAIYDLDRIEPLEPSEAEKTIGASDAGQQQSSLPPLSLDTVLEMEDFGAVSAREVLGTYENSVKYDGAYCKDPERPLDPEFNKVSLNTNPHGGKPNLYYHRTGSTRFFAEPGGFEVEAKSVGEAISTRLLAKLAEEEVLEVNRMQMPVFPVSILERGAAGRYAAAQAKCIEPPATFMFMSHLAMMGCATSNIIKVKSEIDITPRIFVALIGESSDTRKSTGINKTKNAFIAALPGAMLFASNIGSAEALLTIGLTPSEVESFDSEKQPPVRLMLSYDELSLLVKKAAIKNSGLAEYVNRLFEDTSVDFHVKNFSRFRNGIHMSLLGGSTVETFRGFFTDEMKAMGLPNRFFLVPARGERRHPVPTPMCPVDRTLITNDIKAIFEHCKKLGELEFTAEAMERFEVFYFRPDSDLPEQKRIDTYVLRLAANLAINELKTEIDIDAISAAIELGEWQVEVRKIYMNMNAPDKIAELEKKITDQLKKRGGMPGRELIQFTNARRSDSLGYYNRAIKNLVTAQVIVEDFTPRGAKKYKLSSKRG